MVTVATTVQQALQRVVNNPEHTTDPIDTPVHELVSRALFDIANNPNSHEKGSFTRANKARRIILDRLVGRRRAGSRPIRPQGERVAFLDLTDKELGLDGEPEQEVTA